MIEIDPDRNLVVTLPNAPVRAVKEIRFRIKESARKRVDKRLIHGVADAVMAPCFVKENGY